MPQWIEGPTLGDCQRYVAALEEERGFAAQSARDKCLLLGEEVGELFRAVRKATGLAVDPSSTVRPVADELADILIYVCSVANRFDVDLEEALRLKEERNRTRTWSPSRGAGPASG